MYMLSIRFQVQKLRRCENRLLTEPSIIKFAFRHVACFSKEWNKPEITVDNAENERIQLECEKIIMDAINEHTEKEDDKGDSV